jgi:hypothetical protein
VSSSRFPSTRSDDIRFPDGIPAEVELLRERLVDDRNPGRAGGIGGRELAAGQQAPPERAEVRRTDLVVVRVVVGIRLFREPLDVHVLSPAAAREQRDKARRDAADAGHGREFLFEAFEQRAGTVGRVRVQPGRETERHDMAGVQPEVHPADIRQAPDEEPRRDEQRHRQRNLQRRQRRPEARR